MIYKVLWSDDDSQHNLPEPLPALFKSALDGEFAKISANPQANSSEPRSPPYAQGGRVREFSVVDPADRSRYYFAIFFEIDELRREVGVTRIAVQPSYGRPKG